MKKKIIVFPAEYPTNENPLGGIFVKELNLAFSQYSNNDIYVFYNYFLSIKKLTSNNFFYYFGTRSYFKEKKINNCFNFLISPYFNFFKLYIDRKLTENFIEKYIKLKGKPDIIICHFSFPSAYTARYIYQKFKIPYIIIEHSTGYFTNIFSNYQLKKIKIAMKDAKKVITVSSFLEKKIKQIFLAKNTETIGNVIDFENFKITKKIKNKKIRFTVICELVKKKQIYELLEVFNNIKNKNPNFHLNIIGDGSERLRLEKFVKINNLKQNITFKGILNKRKICNLIKYTDYLVSCSTIETFGISICESLASGTPVVVLDSGGPRDFLTKKNSIFVNNFKNLEREIVKILIGKTKIFSRQYLRKSIKKKFHPKIIVKKFDKLIENILR